MRRLVRPVLGLLLVGVSASSAAAQRVPESVPAAVIGEPRPNPVLPAALVPFVIPSEVCRKDHQPLVALKVYNVLAQPVAILRLRSRRAEAVDSRRMRCGTYVAIWDGTIGGGARVAPPGIYYLQLAVDDRPYTRKMIVTKP